VSRISLNSNISSLNAQRQLSVATNKLTQNFTRLSSGLRINRASDDAAGLSVSSLLNIDKKVASQGVRNLNDGASYLNVAESALSELTNIVTRIGEIAAQAANGTLGTAQRSALQSEVTALQDEYNRILEVTEFNGKQLLTGTDTATILQGGYGTGGQLAVQIGDASGETSLISVGSSGTQGNATSVEAGSFRSISGDGRYVSFVSAATNLVSGDTNGVTDVFVKDSVTGAIEIASKTYTGAEANGASNSASISTDGNYVIFRSAATNLIASDANGATNDVFLRDLSNDTTELISSSSAGVQGNSSSTSASVSADGRYVVFLSNATNLVAGDVNLVADIFMKDRETGVTTLISQSTAGVAGNAASNINRSHTVSADGRYVAFISSASNLVAGDTNMVADVFVRDTVLNTTTRVSLSTSGTEGNQASDAVSISADGRYVLFTSLATNLVSGDTNAVYDNFVRDLVTGTTTRVSTSSNGDEANGYSNFASISGDGKYVSFTSAATNLVSGDTNSVDDIFVKNLETGEVVRASVSTDGTQSGGTSYRSEISSDGRYVMFDSDASNLVSGDANILGDVFLRELSGLGIDGLSGMLVTDQGSAATTLNIANRYIEDLALARAGIGASMSRISSFLNTLQTAQVNYESAISAILDADVAAEATGLVANRILQSSASSVLAQANQQPSLAIQLLTGIK
jgi:flagellin-like hook-associated protein FlgL